MLNYRLGTVNEKHWGFKPVFRCSKPHTFSTFSAEAKEKSVHSLFLTRPLRNKTEIKRYQGPKNPHMPKDKSKKHILPLSVLAKKADHMPRKVILLSCRPFRLHPNVQNTMATTQDLLESKGIQLDVRQKKTIYLYFDCFRQGS